ncbi:MBOAT family protein [Wolinella succinogenes]|uniref:MBOAT family O-acyltransferase n=1 Tax=Wolinella succinogenes TaxID=844 RepID=UPI002FC909A3
MLFNSVEFIFLFLPITWVVYFGLIKQRKIFIAKAWLVGASLFFYAYWNLNYLPLLLLSIMVNFSTGSALTLSHKNSLLSPWKKLIATFGVSFNLLLLGYYKYTDFLFDNFNTLGFDLTLPRIILPLGISFFTFTQIAFLVDSYRGKAKEYSLLNYMLFVTYFPHLLAGPILHHKDMMPQFANSWNWVVRWKNVAIGLFIFSVGLFKKVIIADYFAPIADKGFANPDILNAIEAWGASLAYTMQLYFDFSGYCDMAIGASLLFNIRLPINFNSPYKALNIQDFWRRWHITLGAFLRDYVYIPLGGSRVQNSRVYFNLIVTFFLGGLWHGAGWTFVFWGLLHGLALAIHRWWSTLGIALPKAAAWLLTFLFVHLSWVFFRAEDLPKALAMLKNMFWGNLPSGNLSAWLIHLETKPKFLLFLVIALLVVRLLPNSNRIPDYFKPNTLFGIIFVILMFICITNLNHHQAFLYFNF